MTIETPPRDGAQTVVRNQSRQCAIRMDVLDGRTPEGYLQANAFLGRTGIQHYQREDGTTVRELRLPEEVFATDAMESALHKVLTDGHPPIMLDATNTDKYQRGSIIGPIGREQGDDVEYLTSKIQVTHQDTIAAIDEGRSELSLGYLCDLDYTPGTHPIWGAYDAIQRNIRINHVSRVDRGRAGKEVRVRFDAQELDPSAMPDPQKQNTKKQERSIMIKFDIDGHPVEGSEAAKARFDAYESKKDGEVKSANDRAKKEAKRADDAESKLSEAQKQIAETNAKLDAANDKVKALENDLQNIDARMDERNSLIADAKLVMGKEYDGRGKSDDQIRSDAVSKAIPNLKLDDYTDEQKPVYIKARFDGLIESIKNDDGQNDPVLGAYDQAETRTDSFWDQDSLAEEA